MSNRCRISGDVNVSNNFISEDDLIKFDRWLEYQGIDASTITPDELAMWRDVFDEARARALATAKVGRMKLGPPPPGEHRYAVAVREGADLWLTLWIRRSPKGDVFVMIPRGDSDWDPHTSYHRNGKFHMKSYRHKFGPPKSLQPLTGAFKGTEHLGAYGGHGPKGGGAICDPAAFSGVVEVAPGVLGPRDGAVIVDLVQPGCEPMLWQNVVKQEVFRNTVPWLVIRISSPPRRAAGSRGAPPLA